MSDAFHQIGNDLALSATGDIALATGATYTQQRVLRRLLTNHGDYLWALEYGGGLGAMVGQPLQPAAVRSLVLAQIFEEATVAQVPEPTVTLTESAPGEPVLTIAYADAQTGQISNAVLQLGNTQ